MMTKRLTDRELNRMEIVASLLADSQECDALRIIEDCRAYRKALRFYASAITYNCRETIGSEVDGFAIYPRSPDIDFDGGRIAREALE